MSQSPQQEVSIDAFWAIPEAERFHEFYGGGLVPKAVPSGEHGGAQVGVVAAVAPRFQRRGGSGGPGGWWIATEVEAGGVPATSCGRTCSGGGANAAPKDPPELRCTLNPSATRQCTQNLSMRSPSR
jgi:hypothetical protein